MIRSRVPSARRRIPVFTLVALVPVRADLAPPFTSPTLALPQNCNHARLRADDLMIVLRPPPEPKVGMKVSASDKPPVTVALTSCDHKCVVIILWLIMIESGERPLAWLAKGHLMGQLRGSSATAGRALTARWQSPATIRPC